MVIQPGGPSVGGDSGATSSAARAIPPLDSGDNPKWVHVSIVPQDKDGAAVLFGQSAVAAATLVNGIGVSSQGPGVIINVAGNTHYRIISGDADTPYTMTPLAGVFTSR